MDTGCIQFLDNNLSEIQTLDLWQTGYSVLNEEGHDSHGLSDFS